MKIYNNNSFLVVEYRIYWGNNMLKKTLQPCAKPHFNLFNQLQTDASIVALNNLHKGFPPIIY